LARFDDNIVTGRKVGGGVAGPDTGRRVEVWVEGQQLNRKHVLRVGVNTGQIHEIVARVGDLLAWMDLEMTGLDPAKHVIVEIATLLTDDDLNIIAEGPDLVIHATDEELSRMDDVVVEMHTKSGLLEEIKASTVTLEEATKQTLDFLRSHIPEQRSVPLCGNSIGMDRRFLAIYMTEVEEFLHYRSIDVSTLKELARRWLPSVLDSAPRKEVGHRALDDITESIKELRYYREALFSAEANGVNADQLEPQTEAASADATA